MFERRFIKGQKVKVRAGAKPGIEGYAAVFGDKYDSGWFIETIAPGAFDRALKEAQDVRCLFNHDPNNLLGRTKSKTLSLAVDATGLHYDCDLNPDTRIATEVHSMVAREDLDGCSFAFTVRKQTWSEETDAEGKTTNYRTIEDLDLFDVGPVTYPAYEGTSVGARSVQHRQALWPDGVPLEVRSHVTALRDAQDGDPNSADTPEPAAEACECNCRACFGGDCDECEMYMETCGDADRCAVPMQAARAKRDDAKKTKRVDGEDLPASAFLYVGDPDQTSTWALPWKFSTDDKTKRHLQNALARFSQTQKIPADKKAAVHKELVAKCKEYGIHVADDSGKNSADVLSIEQARARVETARAALSL